MSTRSPEDTESGQQIAGLVSVGQQLASARNEQKLSVQSVASELRLSVAVIQALEEGDEDNLPAQTYLRGYIRAYAKRLGLDGASLVAQLPDVDTLSVQLSHRPQRTTQLRVSLPSLKWVYRIILVGLLVMVVLYGIPLMERWWSEHFVGTPSDSGVDTLVLPDIQELIEKDIDELEPPLDSSFDTEPKKTNAVESKATEFAEQVKTVVVESVLLLRFVEDSWVEVQAQGEKLINSVQVAGTEQTVRASPPFSVLLGNAPAVEILYNGVPVNIAPYRRGKVARLVLGDRDVE